MEAHKKVTNLGKIMQSAATALNGKDLLKLTNREDRAKLAIYQECQNKLEVYCEFCGGFGHVYKQCITRKQMTKSLREYGYKKQWGDAKGEFWEKMIEKKADLAEQARLGYKV